MKNRILALLFLLNLAVLPKLFSQNVSINSTGSMPDTSAMLDVSSNAKGFLLPRMTTTDRNAIILPANGLIIYNTTLNAFQVNTGTTTVSFWATLGNGSGSVTSVATGYGLSGGPITTTGTLIVDTLNLSNWYLRRKDSTGVAGFTTVYQNSLKQNQLNGTGFVKAAGTTITYDNNTYLTANQSITFTPSGDVTGTFSGTGAITPTLSIGANKVTLAQMAQVANGTFLGRTSAGAGNVEALTTAQAKTMLGLSGSSTGANTGDVTLGGQNYLTISGQVITANPVNLSGSHVTGILAAARFPALTGDVTNTVGTVATTIANGVVNNAKLATMAANSFKANPTGATAAPTDITGTQATAMLNVFTPAFNGLVPLSGAGTSNFLRGDGTWQPLSATAWGLTGNSGTTAATNFAGTTDANGFRIKGNNIQGLLVDSLGNVAVGTAPTFAPLLSREKFLVDAGVTSSVNAISAKGSINSYLQLNIQNQSGGAAASSDIVATASGGTETTNYIDMGINGSGNTSNIFGNSNDAYLYNQGENFFIGNSTPAKSLIFMTGGTDSATNERIRISGTGNVGIGNPAPAEKLDVNGNVRFSGALMPNNTPGTAGSFLTSGGAGLPPTWTTGTSGVNSGDVTLGTPNGLSLSAQVLSLGLSSASGTGALSSTDWTTFNNKLTTIDTTNIANFSTKVRSLMNAGTAISYDNTTGIISNTGVTSLNGATGNINFPIGNLTEAGSSVLTITGGTTAVLGTGTTLQVKQAGATQNGFLSSTDWNIFNSKSDTANGWNTTGNPGTSSGTNFIGTTDNKSLAVRTNNTQGLLLDSLGNVGIGTSPTFTAGVPREKFLVDAGTLANPTTSYNVISGKGYIDNYMQLNIQNRAATASASSDVVASNDAATEAVNFIDMGINSSGNTSTGVLGGTNTGYLYTTGNDFAIGNAIANKNLLFFTGGILAANERMRIDGNGNVGIGVTAPTAFLHLKAGTAAVNTAPLKFTSGPLLSTAAIGAVEFLTDKFYGTITTGTARKEFTLNDGAAGLTAARVPFATTNGRLTDLAAFTYATNRLSPTYITLGAGAAAAGNAPLVFTTGVNLTVPVTGAVEFNGTHFYGTVGTTRFQLDQQAGTTYTGSNGITLVGSDFRNNLITGITGGQTVIGGTAASNSLTLSSTSHATKGSIIFGSSAYDEVNNRLGLGNNVPTEVLDITGNLKFSGALMPNNLAGASGTFLTSTGTGTPPVWAAFDTTNIPLFSQKVRSLFSSAAPVTYANGVIGITQAGTLTDGYLSSTDWNTFNNKSDATNSWTTSGNSVASAQKIGTITNFDFPFITNNTEKMRLSAGGNLGIGNTVVDGTNAEKLLVDAGTTSYNVISGKGNLNNYLQLNIKNINSGTSASSDVVATNDAGTEANGLNFVDMGVNSSGNTSAGVLGGPNTGYLYSTGADFSIGNATAGNNLLLFTGGVASANERMRIDGNGNVGIGVTAPTAFLHLKAGTTLASTAPLKFTSGNLMTTAEAGGVEFLTDKFYGTITSAASRKEFALNETSLTSARVPFANASGRLTDLAAFTYLTNRLSPTYITLGAGTATAGTAPLVFTSGTNLTTPVDGAVEYNGTHFYGSVGGTRYQLDQQVGTTYTASNGITLSGLDFRNNLITGIAGGQTITSGTAAGNSLTLSSTSNAAKGKIIFGSSAYDELNNRLGVGNSTPTEKLDVTGNVKFSGALMPNNLAGASGTFLTSTGAGTAPVWSAFDTTSIPSFSLKVRSLFSSAAPVTYANGVIGITQAGTLTDGYLSSTDWNTFNNKSDATNSWTTSGNSVASAQKIGTITNFDFPFITNNIEAMRLSAGGNLGIGNTVVDGTNAEKLLVDAGTTSYNVISGKGNLNNYLQLNIKNINSGTSASSDVVATNDAGTEANGLNFVDMGVNSSGNTSAGVLGGPNTGYLYSTGADFSIGNATAGNNLLLFTGGVAAANERMRIDGNGNVGIGVTAPTAVLHLKAGTTVASTAPLKFTSGNLMTTAEAGGVEFLTDKFYGTITSAASRKEFALNETSLTSTRVPFANASGRLTDLAAFTYLTNRLSPTYITLGAGTATAGTAPLVFTSGVILATPLTGAVEFNGTHFFGTVGGTRFQLDQQAGTTYTGSNGITFVGTDIRNNLITGVAGGQTIIGGTASGNALTLSSTSNATKGKLIFGTSAYDELNNRLGVANSTPTEKLDVTGNVKFSGALMPNNLAGASGTLLTSTGAGTPPVWAAFDTTSIPSFSLKVRSLFSSAAPVTYANGVIGITQAGALTDGYLSSTDWNTFNNKSDATNSWTTSGNSVASAQKIGTITNFDFPFITNNTEKMRLSAGGNLGIGNTVVDGTNAERLLVDAGTTSYNVISGKGNLNNYLQLNIKNINSGTSASSDVVATNDAGTEANGLNFVDMGVNSSGNTSGGVLGGPNTGYLYSTGADFSIGNATAGNNLLLFTGGVAAANERMRIDGNGNVGIGVTAPTAVLHLKAGTAVASTAPLKFTSGNLLTTAEVGGVEFLTDKFYGTITTAAARKEFTLNETSLTSARVPFANASGRLTDLAAFTYLTNRLSPTYITLGAGTATAGTAPLLFTSGVILTTPAAGAVEFDGTHFYGTVGGTRYQFDQQAGTTYTGSTGITLSGTDFRNNLITGVAGGQTIIGGTASGNPLTLSSTSHAVKGKIIFGTSAYDELNNRLGVANSTPTEKLDVTGNVKFSGALMPGGTAGTAGFFLQSMGGGTPPVWFDASGFAWQLNGNAVAGIKTLGTTNAVDLPFITNNTEQMRITSAGNVGIGTSTFNGSFPEQLIVDAGAPGTAGNYQNVIVGKGNTNSYAQLNIQNINAGAAASSDVVATADNGNESVNFIDMGINSSTNAANAFGGLNDAYLYAIGNGVNTGGNLYVGTATASRDVTFLTGGGTKSSGTTMNNERMRILGSNGNIGMGTNAPTSTLHVKGSVSHAIMLVNTAGTYTLDATNYTFIIKAGSGSAVNVVLPAASSCSGRMYIVVVEGGFNESISTYFDMAGNTQTSVSSHTSYTLQSDGTSWYQVQ